MTNKEEVLKQLLKNILEERLHRLEKRNLEQMKDLKLEKDIYKKQELLVDKFSLIKIEPKKPSKPTNNNHNRQTRIRDKTPNNFGNRRKNSIKKEIKGIRSKTPDIAERKRRPERKEKAPVTNIRSDKKDIKKSIRGNNNKTPGYMNPINITNKIKKNIDKSKPITKAHTPDVKKKNIISNVNKTKQVNKNIEKNMNNLNLIDLKTDDMKEHITTKEKHETKESKKEKFNFDSILNEAKIINSISSLLDQETRYNFLSCNSNNLSCIFMISPI